MYAGDILFDSLGPTYPTNKELTRNASLIAPSRGTLSSNLNQLIDDSSTQT